MYLRHLCDILANPVTPSVKSVIERRHVLDSAEYESGKRFLAKIMCEDPETFTDKDVKVNIDVCNK